MFGNTTLLTQSITQSASPYRNNQISQGRFNRVFLVGQAARFINRLFGRSTRLQDLQNVLSTRGIGNGRYIGTRTIELNQIVGSEGRSRDFDNAFRPVTTHTQERWIGILNAKLTGKVLPPVDLVQVGDNYFVRDGNHRVSVARALGERFIDATITLLG